MTEPFSRTERHNLQAKAHRDAETALLEQPMLTTKEVADFLRITVDTLYAWRSIGDGPKGHKFGKHLRFDRDDLLAFVASKKER